MRIISKRLFSVILFALLLVVLAACGDASRETSYDRHIKSEEIDIIYKEKIDHGVFLYKVLDKKSGCQFMITDTGARNGGVDTEQIYIKDKTKVYPLCEEVVEDPTKKGGKKK